MREHIKGTVVAADFSSDEETLITISVPADTRWGYEPVVIVKTDGLARARTSQDKGEPTNG